MPIGRIAFPSSNRGDIESRLRKLDYREKCVEWTDSKSEADPNDTWNQESLTWYTDQIKAAKANP